MQLSAASKAKLDAVHGDLRAVILRAGDLTLQPFEVSEGMRTLEKQREYVKKGTSQTLDSRHLDGHAADLAAIVDGRMDFDHREPYTPIWNAVRTAAAELGVPIEWGGNWASFPDVFHFALPWAQYPKGTGGEVSFLAPGRGFDAAKFETCVAFVLAIEGGYNADDPSNRGITLDTLRRWQPDAALKDLKALDEGTAKRIYRALYWAVVRGDDLPAGLDLAVFDFAVHSGTGVAAMLLQEAVGAEADAIIGPLTLAAVKAADLVQTIGAVCDKRLDHMKGRPNWSRNQKGWTARVRDVRAKALHMAETGAPAGPVRLAGVSTLDLLTELLARPDFEAFNTLRKELQ